MTIGNLHPDDVLFFHEVLTAMRRVAKDYNLPLRSVEGLPMPIKGMADRLGDCQPSSGHIRLVLRCTVDGEWCSDPMSPNEVWDTAAHELAHLKYRGHDQEFQELHAELIVAIRNQTPDHRERVIAKLVKMQHSRDGEAAIGNEKAAEAFAQAINRMLIEHELNPSDLDYARATDHDPVIELRVNLESFGIEKVKTRVAWQQSLARVVAKAHLCQILISGGRNDIWFVGTRSHAQVAEYAYGVLVPAAKTMSMEAGRKFRRQLRKEHGLLPGRSLRGISEGFGFRESWLEAFVDRIAERFDEVRRSAIATVPQGSESTALVRLNGALLRVQKYVDDKFSKHKASRLGYIGGRRLTSNSAGRAAGKAAADRMAIGQRSIARGAVRGKLTE